MEIVFLVILVLLMVGALASGFPVAFALPGSAILAIGLAALCGFVFEDNPSAYFAQDGPLQWLSAAVTNFRSLYWDVDRDTLIAIPLFVFMGLMLQRSKIAEDLLVTMAQLFGPIPGGLGISVVFVGALIAATTGIVGATVIAMGLISLPAMLRNNYSKPLATGTICASGTLGQIIPPSIVLIILADQLASASDQASSIRKAEYKLATGEFSMPAELDVTSASAGDLFMGALVPGLLLAALYMVYILIVALIRPSAAPPVPYEGKRDRWFALRVLLALAPPLTLIFVVLGSILVGIATVNQAGTIGAIGATIMASYRLSAGKANAYLPTILALVSIAGIMLALRFFDLNVKSIEGSEDVIGIALGSLAVAGLLVAVGWSLWRTWRIDDTLRGVMVETAKSTSMVFIILIGAAMLTAAFRGFGGEQLVREFLGGLPGGFWSQFIVVMAVIFVLGFFIDFIEIAVVVVPIVAPILLADPAANVTAVWFGVMVGLNLQTSFLTPPFGFALFYLRGVAPKIVSTLQIYKGVVAFVALQLLGLTIAGAFPSLTNYLPNRAYLTSETAPPPMNPRLQGCLEVLVFHHYDQNEEGLVASIEAARSLDLASVPEEYRKLVEDGFPRALATFDLVRQVRESRTALAEEASTYQPLHREVRRLQAEMRAIDGEMEERRKDKTRISRNADADQAEIDRLGEEIRALEGRRSDLAPQIPDGWEAAHQRYRSLAENETKALRAYRQNVDAAYEGVKKLREALAHAPALTGIMPRFESLEAIIATSEPAEAMSAVRELEAAMGEIAGAAPVAAKLSDARRALSPEMLDRDRASAYRKESLALLREEIAWRQRADAEIGPALARYDVAIRDSVGLRLQDRLTKEQALAIASCQSVHRDISLHF